MSQSIRHRANGRIPRLDRWPWIYKGQQPLVWGRKHCELPHVLNQADVVVSEIELQVSGGAGSLADAEGLQLTYLTEHGVMSPALLYETPFIDFHHAGPNGLFTPAKVEELMAVLEFVRTTAIAA